MALVTKGRTFVSGEVVTPTKLNSLVDSATVTQIQTADISDAQITTAKIADSNVTSAKIADSNVTTAKIADGAITGAKLNSSVILVPTGAVMPFAMNSAPSGWLAADGTEYSKTGTYATLFAAIGVTYGETNGAGGVGTTHFRVPDLRGYFVRGAGTNSDGIASGTFGVKQADDFKSHNHTSSTIVVRNIAPIPTGWNVPNLAGNLDPNNTVTTTSTGGTETRPRNIAMLYCIKF
ncbi:MAG: tail fiber protein [Proteobacteria bacterium]|nr:tail fiber protein [Pseudomonadota bacterium]